MTYKLLCCLFCLGVKVVTIWNQHVDMYSSYCDLWEYRCKYGA